MRARVILIILFLALIAALFLIWPFRSDHSKKTSRSPESIAGEAPPEQTSQATGKDMEQGNNLGRMPQTQTPPAQTVQNTGSLITSTQEALIQWTNMLQEIQRTVNGPIEFYGKVVDGNNNPVEAATIEFGCTIYPEDYFKTNVLTDSNGLFSLTNTNGARLSLRISKQGYSYVREQNPQTSFTFTILPAFANERFQPDSNNPVVFYLHKD